MALIFGGSDTTKTMEGFRLVALTGNAQRALGYGATTPAVRRELSFPCLHGLRGILALWVVSVHTNSGGHGLFQLFNYGGLAVDVFFMMSGFVLTHSHHGDFEKLPGSLALRFLYLRFWRTVPVHLITICISLFISIIVFGFWPGALEVTRNIVFFDSWYVPPIARHINVPVWSLGVEWMGYLAFPWLCWLLLSIRSFRVVAILVPTILALEIFLLSINGTPIMAAIAGTEAFVRMAGSFFVGCLLWVGFQHPISRSLSGDWLMLAAICAATIVLLVADTAYSLGVLACIVLLAARPGPATAMVLGSPVCMFLGRISFSLYMVHYPIVRVFYFLQLNTSAGLPSGLFSAAAVAAAILTATLVCVLAEEPLRRFGRALTRMVFPLPKARAV